MPYTHQCRTGSVLGLWHQQQFTGAILSVSFQGRKGVPVFVEGWGAVLSHSGQCKSIWRPVSVWYHRWSLQRSPDLLAGFRDEGSPSLQERGWQEYESSLLWRTMAPSKKFKSRKKTEDTKGKGKWMERNGGKKNGGRVPYRPPLLFPLQSLHFTNTLILGGQIQNRQIGWLYHCLHCYCCYYGWRWPLAWWSHAQLFYRNGSGPSEQTYIHEDKRNINAYLVFNVNKAYKLKRITQLLVRFHSLLGYICKN